MNIKESIIQHLQDDLDLCYEDDNEFTVRCPYCGDSDNPEHAHLGIMIDVEDSIPMIWNCFRCGEGGMVTDKLLLDLGIDLSAEEAKELRSYDRKMKKLANTRQNSAMSARYRPCPTVTKYGQTKIRYIEDRLGVHVDPVREKLVPSLIDFLNFNEIKMIAGLKPWKLRRLDRNYLGFLSTNNNCITFRRINDDEKLRRYDKILINPYMPDIGSFYSIPTQMNYFYQDDVHIHIAEGTFDIISIKKNLEPMWGPNQLFYASCGFSYTNILRHLFRNGIVTDWNLHIYADRDKTDSVHRQALRRSPFSEMIKHAWIHRNHMEGEKDFGVIREQIDEKCRQLW